MNLQVTPHTESTRKRRAEVEARRRVCLHYLSVCTT